MSGVKMQKGLIFFWLVMTCLVFLPAASESAYLRNARVTVTQPDGQVLHCLASGDEYHNWLHDEEGFTIVQDPDTGYYVYAVRSDGGLTVSALVAGEADPVKAGIERKVNLLPAALKTRLASRQLRNPQNMTGRANAPQSGLLNNVVIFIRFSDEDEFTDLLSLYDSRFNSADAGANSVYNYFRETSYNRLSVSSSFYPPSSGIVVSYQDSNPRSYYRPFNAATNPGGYQSEADSTAREHILLKNAVDAVSSLIDPGLVVDSDGDGEVDNVCFILKGMPDGLSDVLWPHMWSLYTQTATINGKTVGTYNIQLQGMAEVGVLSHELFHSLGAPDLYHYSQDGLEPVWQWDLMEWDLNPPQHMGAYLKARYAGWIDEIPVITTSGTYTLNPLTSSSGNAWRINSPYSATEYYILEYRRRTGTFESSLPGEGLLIYRINSLVTEGNRNGPPDEVYVYRPGGTTTGNGSPLLAPFSSNSGRTGLNDATDPSGFLSSGSAGGLDISNVTSAGSTISFTYTVTEPPPSMCSERVSDGGFEAGTPSAAWGETSTNFGTPLCDQLSCDHPARTGDWYAWFGGIEAAETGTLSQTVTLAAGGAQSLQFYLWIPVSSGNNTDYFRVSMDGAAVFSVLEGDAAYSEGYTLVTVDLSAYADGNPHELLLESVVTGSGQSDFLVDDLSIGKCSTTTSLVSDINPSAEGQTVTFTATVSAASGTPGGTVQFSAYGAALGPPVLLNSGTAVLSTSALLPGTHMITATYGGNSGFSGSSGILAGGQQVTAGGPAVQCKERVLDGGFEAGVPNAFWDETSTNFGTPLCDLTTCGGTYSRTGDWYAWFGGVVAAETGTLSQTVTLASGVAQSLQFYLWVPGSSGNNTDYLMVKIDGTTLFYALESDTAYADGYTLVEVDLSAYADGNAHVLLFESVTTGESGVSNFMVDDVSIGCSTATSLASDINPSDEGQLVTFTASVSAGSGTPEGVVQFSVDGLPLGPPVVLSGGEAVFSTPSLAAGTYAITADYGGNPGFFGSSGLLAGGQTVLSGPCAGPVRIGSTDYPTIGEAYLAAQGLEIKEIRLRRMDFVGNLDLDQEIGFTLAGGYACDFSSSSGYSTIRGALDISRGSVTIDSIVIQAE